MKIIPVILTNSSPDLEKKINFLEGKTDWVQIDVTDSKFGGEATFPLEWLGQYQDKQFFWDIHLMVDNPFAWVEKCNLIIAQRVIGQIELMNDQLDFLDRVESEGMEAGLAVDLATPLERIDQEVFWRCSVILLLGVKAGRGGQEFEKSCLKKIRRLMEMREELKADFAIGVDGGINKNNLLEIQEAGADIAFAGSAIWNREIKLKKDQEKII
ncbi:hypothetical protein ISS42_00680 [Candidatus Shapirobacteria bacterium]|nr:hypothetical protein [Candidatus Shapirobacteria bacterium]